MSVISQTDKRPMCLQIVQRMKQCIAVGTCAPSEGRILVFEFAAIVVILGTNLYAVGEARLDSHFSTDNGRRTARLSPPAHARRVSADPALKEP